MSTFPCYASKPHATSVEPGSGHPADDEAQGQETRVVHKVSPSKTGHRLKPTNKALSHFPYISVPTKQGPIHIMPDTIMNTPSNQHQSQHNLQQMGQLQELMESRKLQKQHLIKNFPVEYFQNIDMLYRLNSQKSKGNFKGREEGMRNRHGENHCNMSGRGSLDAAGKTFVRSDSAMDKGARMFSDKARKIEELTTQNKTKNNRKMAKTSSQQGFKPGGTYSSQFSKYVSPSGFKTAPQNIGNPFDNTRTLVSTPTQENSHPFKQITTKISNEIPRNRKMLTSPKRLPPRQQLSLQRSKTTQQSKSKENLFKKRQVQKVKTQQGQYLESQLNEMELQLMNNPPQNEDNQPEQPSQNNQNTVPVAMVERQDTMPVEVIEECTDEDIEDKKTIKISSRKVPDFDEQGIIENSSKGLSKKGKAYAKIGQEASFTSSNKHTKSELEDPELKIELERLRLSAQDNKLESSLQEKKAENSEDALQNHKPPHNLAKTTSIGQNFVSQTSKKQPSQSIISSKDQDIVIVQPPQATERNSVLSKKAAPSLEKQSTSEAERNFREIDNMLEETQSEPKTNTAISQSGQSYIDKTMLGLPDNVNLTKTASNFMENQAKNPPIAIKHQKPGTPKSHKQRQLLSSSLLAMPEDDKPLIKASSSFKGSEVDAQEMDNFADELDNLNSASQARKEDDDFLNDDDWGNLGAETKVNKATKAAPKKQPSLKQIEECDDIQSEEEEDLPIARTESADLIQTQGGFRFVTNKKKSSQSSIGSYTVLNQPPQPVEPKQKNQVTFTIKEQQEHLEETNLFGDSSVRSTNIEQSIVSMDLKGIQRNNNPSGKKAITQKRLKATLKVTNKIVEEKQDDQADQASEKCDNISMFGQANLKSVSEMGSQTHFISGKKTSRDFPSNGSLFKLNAQEEDLVQNGILELDENNNQIITHHPKSQFYQESPQQQGVQVSEESIPNKTESSMLIPHPAQPVVQQSQPSPTEQESKVNKVDSMQIIPVEPVKTASTDQQPEVAKIESQKAVKPVQVNQEPTEKISEQVQKQIMQLNFLDNSRSLPPRSTQSPIPIFGKKLAKGKGDFSEPQSVSKPKVAQPMNQSKQRGSFKKSKGNMHKLYDINIMGGGVKTEEKQEELKPQQIPFLHKVSSCQSVNVDTVSSYSRAQSIKDSGKRFQSQRSGDSSKVVKKTINHCKIEEAYIISESSSSNESDASQIQDPIVQVNNVATETSEPHMANMSLFPNSLQPVSMVRENSKKDISTETNDAQTSHEVTKPHSLSKNADISLYCVLQSYQIKSLPNKQESINEQLWSVVEKVLRFIDSQDTYFNRLTDNQSIWLYSPLSSVMPTFTRWSLPQYSSVPVKGQLKQALTRLLHQSGSSQPSIRSYFQSVLGMPLLLVRETCFNKLDNLYRHSNIFGFTYGQGDVWRIVGTVAASKGLKERKIRLQRLQNKEIREVLWSKFTQQYRHSFISCFKSDYHLRFTRSQVKDRKPNGVKLSIKDEDKSAKWHCIVGAQAEDQKEGLSGKILVYSRVEEQKKGEQCYKYIGSGDISLVSMKLKAGEYMLVFELSEESQVSPSGLTVQVGCENKNIELTPQVNQ